MTDDELTSRKKTAMMPALMLCLVDKWTFSGEPSQDLNILGIEPESARRALVDLVNRGLVRGGARWHGQTYGIEWILDEPNKFREAHILTARGREFRRDYDLQEMQKRWQRF